MTNTLYAFLTMCMVYTFPALVRQKDFDLKTLVACSEDWCEGVIPKENFFVWHSHRCMYNICFLWFWMYRPRHADHLNLFTRKRDLPNSSRKLWWWWRNFCASHCHGNLEKVKAESSYRTKWAERWRIAMTDQKFDLATYLTGGLPPTALIVGNHKILTAKLPTWVKGPWTNSEQNLQVEEIQHLPSPLGALIGWHDQRGNCITFVRWSLAVFTAHDKERKRNSQPGFCRNPWTQ